MPEDERKETEGEPLVLVVDDDPAMRRLIELELTSQGFQVLSQTSGEAAIRVAESQRPSLVVLDLVLPDMSGLDVMRLIRKSWNVPVILLTGLHESRLKIQGLDMGADDYLTKPFFPEELSARVRAILRRPGMGRKQETENVVKAGDVDIDLGRRLAMKKGEVVHLTRNEWALLKELASNAGRVMVYEQLLNAVWGPEYLGDLQYLRVWISRLRYKLEDDPSHPRLIKTVGGVGYLLDSYEHFTEGGHVRDSAPTGLDDTS